MSGDLAGWLLTQISEDEAAAREASTAYVDTEVRWNDDEIDGCRAGVLVGNERWLAECAAKRAIIDMHRPVPALDGCRHCGLVHGRDGQIIKPPLACGECASTGMTGFCDTLYLLAQPYSDRPGFRPEWQVTPNG